MPALRVRRVARQEIDAAFEWYRARSPRAAATFLDDLAQALTQSRAKPERYLVIHGRLRRTLLARFPYGVYFKVFPTVISVVGVIHGRQHPDA